MFEHFPQEYLQGISNRDFKINKGDTMDTELIKTELAKYSITDAAIAELQKSYLTLEIAGINDKEGAALVGKARRDIKSKRCDVEAKRKELKADSLAYGRAVDSEAKRITDELLKIENHLESEEKKISDELCRIENEKYQHRLDLIGVYYPYREIWAKIIWGLSDTAFADELERAKMSHAEEQQRLRAVAEAKKRQEEESEILRRQAAEQEATRQALLAENEKIRKQKAELEERERALELEKKREAGRQAKAKLDAIRAGEERIGQERTSEIENELRKKRETEEAKQRELDRIARAEELRIATENAAKKAVADRIEAERIARLEADRQAITELAELKRKESLRPDREKLNAFAAQLESITTPELQSPIAKGRLIKAIDSLETICVYLRKDF